MVCTLIFSAGEIAYLTSMCWLVISKRELFHKDVQMKIDHLKTLLILMAIALLSSFLAFLRFDMALQIAEWVAFYSDFILRMALAQILLAKHALNHIN